MRCNCPHCAQFVRQDENVEGLNYCTNCRRLFLVPPKQKLPPWIMGVLVVLAGNWQLICRM